MSEFSKPFEAASPPALADYYSRRAPEYESMWERPEPQRQLEQSILAREIGLLSRGRSILECACGTGYWTRYIDSTAERVVAVDLSEAMLEIARGKGLGRTTFLQDDVYRLDKVRGTFNGAVAAFWISHIPRGQVEFFLRRVESRLEPGSPVFYTDNVYVEGVGGELDAPPSSIDTFKLRKLADGTCVRVLKNYYKREELEGMLGRRARNLHIHMGKCFWWARYDFE